MRLIHKATTTLLIIFVTLSLHAQEHVSLSIHQNSRLPFTGDRYGKKEGTIDLLARLKMEGMQQRYGYMIVYPAFQFSNGVDAYRRYSANVGYTLNNIPLPKGLELSGAVGFGFTVSEYGSFHSFSANTEIAYRLGMVKFSFISQIIQHYRLDESYKLRDELFNKLIRYNAFFGMEIRLN